MSKHICCTLAFCSLLLSGCTVHYGYQTVLLPQSFETNAERFEVKAPVSRYKSSFFNVGLGEYQIQDTFIGKVSKRRLSNKPDSRVTEDNTLWNLLTKRTLDFEQVTYDQYRIEETSGFGFSVQSPAIETIQSQCSRSVLGLDNVERGRTSLRFKEIDENEGSVEHYGEWLATRLSCNLQQAGNVWIMNTTHIVDRLANISIQGGERPYTVKVLRQSYADKPGRGGRIENTPDPDFASGDSIPGLGIFQDGKQIAAASLSGGNNWIWLSPEISETDKPMLVSALHNLILDSWIYGL